VTRVTTLRKLRILKTIPVQPTEGHFVNNREMIEAFKDPNTEVVYRGLTNCDVKAVSDEQTRRSVASLHVKMVLDAQTEGFDAVAMGCLLEPGVEEAKRKCKIPIVGALEASLHMASMLGSRFSIIMGGSDIVRGDFKNGTDNILVKLIDNYGMISRVASIRGIGLQVLDFFPEYKNLGKLKELMLRESRRAIESDNANVIIMYGGITVLRYLQERLPVPVLNQKQAQIMMAEALARSQLPRNN